MPSPSDSDPRLLALSDVLLHDPELDIVLDLEDAMVSEDRLSSLAPGLVAAHRAMEALEGGAIANPDEGRRVGHYWLRSPDRAPEPEIAAEVRETVEQVERLAAELLGGRMRLGDAPFNGHVIMVGIGGSALGGQFVIEALGNDAATFHWVDNTDPVGIARLERGLSGRFEGALCVVASKSGGTKETRNGMLMVRAAYERAGVAFEPRAIAITGRDSQLDRQAREEGWAARLPLPDWVGGRTSVWSAVGLFPAALAGIAVREFLAGAARMDAWTRIPDVRSNPAAVMASHWHIQGRGRGDRALVILPYRDRLVLLGRYLQQLVMESLGKHLDRDGRVVDQGLTVYGNKGSTDQHAFVQQLRDGTDDALPLFVESLAEPAEGANSDVDLEVEPGIRSSDYLAGFARGTRMALRERGRPSMGLILPRVDAMRIGAVLALFERTVGLYAELIGINAYHQPGVEAGKAAAGRVLELQRAIVAALQAVDRPQNLAQVCAAVHSRDFGAVLAILRRLAARDADVEEQRSELRITDGKWTWVGPRSPTGP